MSILANSLNLSPAPTKFEPTESNLTSPTDELRSQELSYSSQSSYECYKKSKKVSLAKQNKDGANAARTARITLVSMIMQENKKEVIDVLRNLREDVQIKRLMLNIGQKQFKSRFLFKREFKSFFLEAFQKVSLQNVTAFMRRNKRSQLEYSQRSNLSYEYIRRYEKAFEQRYGKIRVIIPIPLKPQEYLRYIASKNQKSAQK